MKRYLDQGNRIERSLEDLASRTQHSGELSPDFARIKETCNARVH